MPVSARQDDRLYLKLILTDTYRCQSSNGRHDTYSLRSRNDLAQCEAKRPVGKLIIKDREGNAQDTYTQVGNSQVCNKVTCNCNRKIIERGKLISIVIGRIAMVTSGKTIRARSIQPKFSEISVQNSMDRFGSTGKVSKKRVHLLRWTTFPGRTGWNFG